MSSLDVFFAVVFVVAVIGIVLVCRMMYLALLGED